MDIGQALGADGGISVQALTLYVPNKDRDCKEIGDQRRWVLAAAKLLARIGGGVTILPPAEGGWQNPNGGLVWESPVLVYTYVRPTEFRQLMPGLREFLHTLGREMNQGEVAVEFDGLLYRITTFDEDGDPSWPNKARPIGKSKTRRQRTSALGSTNWNRRSAYGRPARQHRSPPFDIRRSRCSAGSSKRNWCLRAGAHGGPGPWSRDVCR